MRLFASAVARLTRRAPLTWRGCTSGSQGKIVHRGRRDAERWELESERQRRFRARKTPVLPLLDALVGMLESGASLTVVGPGTHQGAVFAWLDALVPQHRSRVNVRAQLYPHAGAAIPVLATGQLRRGSPRTSPPSVRIRALDPEGALADSV